MVCRMAVIADVVEPVGRNAVFILFNVKNYES